MPISSLQVSYSDAFKRQLKRLSRKYRRIRSDVQPIIDDLSWAPHLEIKFKD